MEHNIAAICGAWWDTIHSIDGTPRGYKVYTKSDNELSWYYKPVDFTENDIAEVFEPGQGGSDPECYIVNVWDWDEAWTVEWYQDEVYMGKVLPVEQVSPVYVKEINYAYFRYGLEIPSWKRERPCGHHFLLRPSSDAKMIDIKVTTRFGARWKSRQYICSDK